MNSIGILCVLLVCVWLSSGKSEREDFADFQTFLRDFERFYVSPDELSMRFKEFRRNVKNAEVLQLQAPDEVEYGITEYSDWTEDEFSAMVPQFPPFDPAESDSLPDIPVKTDPPPLSCDWRGTWKVRSVKNQGRCGSCWAFSAAGESEGQFHASLSLSPQQLVDCDTYDSGCNGGWPTRGWKYVKDVAGGWESYSSYPYYGYQKTCSYRSQASVFQIVNYGAGTNWNPYTTKYYCYNHGPLSVVMDASVLQYYRGGIISASQCTNPSTNHAVLLVGYGSSNGKTYFIVKNSWGGSWGESGYFKIYYDACLISSYVMLSNYN